MPELWMKAISLRAVAFDVALYLVERELGPRIAHSVEQTCMAKPRPECCLRLKSQGREFVKRGVMYVFVIRIFTCFGCFISWQLFSVTICNS